MSGMKGCSSALWDLVAPKESSRDESGRQGKRQAKRKTGAELATDQQCQEAIKRYKEKVLTNAQLHDIQDRIQDCKDRSVSSEQPHRLQACKDTSASSEQPHDPK